MSRTAVAALVALAALAALACASPPAAAAVAVALGSVRDVGGVTSDRVIVIDGDGRSYTALHTLASDGPTVTLRLPDPVTARRVRFLGPDREAAAIRHRERPDRLELRSGSAFVRYRHRYAHAVQDGAAGVRTLTVSSVPAGLGIGPHSSIEFVTTWVFPPDAEVRSWRVKGAGEGDPSAGAWSFEDNVSSWSQRGTRAVELEIRYRLPAKAEGASPAPASAASETGETSNEVADEVAIVAGAGAGPGTEADTDRDGVPDSRDVCIAAVAAPAGDAVRVPGTSDPVAALGCPSGASVSLAEIGFEIGGSRLDLSARRLLDRLASALSAPVVRAASMARESDGAWEIGAHTDDEGPTLRNQTLSLRRAESVRHYLMLRGVAPERLVAKGYGESDPVASNATTRGRAANRRVELRRPGASEVPVPGLLKIQ